jgi:Co/Zn/Cd efflux system component
MDSPVVEEIQDVIAVSPICAHISNLHVWPVGKGKYACILSLTTDQKATPAYFKDLLSVHEEVVHITVELNPSQ